MHPITSKQEFVNKDKFLELSKTNPQKKKYIFFLTILSLLDLEEFGLFIMYEDTKADKYNFNQSIGIASAVSEKKKIYFFFFKIC